jgi:hypothetical protein
MNQTQTFHNERQEGMEELIQCPYVPSHLLRQARMAQHLIKCKKDTLKNTTSPFHQRAKHMEICKFDTTHHIPKYEMMAHLLVCKSAMPALEDYCGDDQEEEPEWKRCVLPRRPDVGGSSAGHFDEEDWDKEPDVPTYNPMNKVMANPNILYNIQGKTKVERRDFRQDRRFRAANFVDESEEEYVSSKLKYIPAFVKEDKEDHHDQPLRLPEYVFTP